MYYDPAILLIVCKQNMREDGRTRQIITLDGHTHSYYVLQCPVVAQVRQDNAVSVTERIVTMFKSQNITELRNICTYVKQILSSASS